uniref:OrfA n=1 Tax=Halorubrum saccharovorum TaxID=2248 RepID=Q8J302_9EURY|nr:hypothetical protein [Halorubrum saccharovorum]AAO15413.1 orfA [Halorubrum saccharovorum]
MSGDLPDPAPENIDGAKTVQYSHEIHHRINWGYVALGVAAILVVAYVWANVDLSGEDEEASLGGS